MGRSGRGEADVEIRTNSHERELGASELALIHAAERLFAQHGVAGVSLRQVNQAAGNKNMAAAHYHFGSREGLLQAVLKHRMSTIDRRRAELLAIPATPGRERDLRFYLEAYVAPLAEQLAPRAEGNFYLRFLVQYHNLPLDRELLQGLTPAAFIVSNGISDLLRYLPSEIVSARQISVMSMIVSTLADAEGEFSRGSLDDGGLALIVSNLIDAAMAAFTAPISPETLKLLRA